MTRYFETRFRSDPRRDRVRRRFASHLERRWTEDAAFGMEMMLLSVFGGWRLVQLRVSAPAAEARNDRVLLPALRGNHAFSASARASTVGEGSGCR